MSPLHPRRVLCDALLRRKGVARRGLPIRAAVATVAAASVVVGSTRPAVAGDPTVRTRIFDYTGGSQTFVVPPRIKVIAFNLMGAQGGGIAVVGTLRPNVGGGLGGRMTGLLLTTPGESLSVVLAASFDEVVLCSTVSDTDFTAKIDSVAVVVSSVTCTGTSDSTIDVKLASAPSSGQTVSITLGASAVTDPSTNASASTPTTRSAAAA